MTKRDTLTRHDGATARMTNRRPSRELDPERDTRSTRRPARRLDCLHDDERERIIAQALALLEARHALGEPLRSPAETHAYLRLRIGAESRELFGALFLDTRHRVLGNETLFAGTLDATAVYLRVIVQRALALNAGALIVYHNHPSGVPEPSSADRILTARLQAACDLVELQLLDHVVVATEGFVSFAERGWL